MLHHFGQCDFANRDVYVGKWKADLQCGNGSWKSASGASYVGGWDKGIKSGEGRYEDANGDVYQGQWKDDK